MGLVSSSSRKTIEKIAFAAPLPSYTRKHNSLRIMDPKFVPYPSSVIAIMWYESSLPEGENKRPVILYSHGNTSDIGIMHLFLTKLCICSGCSVISYDY